MSDVDAVIERLTADAFARAFMRIRGAHHGDSEDSGQPCDWCVLAGEQAAEAVAALAQPQEDA